MHKTKILATLGPVSDHLPQLQALHASGMSIARLNFSHGTDSWFTDTIDALHELNATHARKISILVDTKGPEMRTRDVVEPIHVEEAGAYSMGFDPASGADILVDYPHLIRDIHVGQTILIDGGTIVMHVTGTTENTLLVRSDQSGIITSRRHVNVPGVHLDLPILDSNDERLLRLCIDKGIDMVAMSFVNTAAQVEEVRRFIQTITDKPLTLVSKIETQTSLDNLEDIVRASDGIMIARGDLAMEIPLELLPTAQRQVLAVCHRHSVPCIVATHMMKSMTDSPTPTRAEILDVGHAVYDGTDAIMTSEETSVGKFPAETIGLMARIAAKTEESVFWQPIWSAPTLHPQIPHPVEEMMNRLTQGCAQVLVYRASNPAALRLLASLRLKIPCIAIAPDEATARYAALAYGQYGVHAEANTEEELDAASLPLRRELFGGTAQRAEYLLLD